MSYEQSSLFPQPRSNQQRSEHEEMSWPSVRAFVLDRDGYRCSECFATERLHVHHLVPRDLGGQDTPSNLIALCDGCHARRHLFLQVSLARKTIEKWAFRLANLLSGSRMFPNDSEPLHRALGLLGVEKFRTGQMAPVLAALRGESVLIVRPTGSGKTLCFQVPGLITPGTTVVFSPLKALISDQIADLHKLQIPATFINSDIGPEEKALRYQMHRQHAWKFLYITPERFDAARLKNPSEIAEIVREKPSYLVIDEAHVVDSWGKDFRPMYGKFREIRSKLGNPPVIALTATAGPSMQDRILDSIGIPDAQRFVAGVDRPNIGLIRHQAKHAERLEVIERFVRNSPGKIMIFVPTRPIGEKVEDQLRKRGLNVPFFHSRKSSSFRSDVINRLTGIESHPLSAVICTNAFGMGLDIPDIRVVIHWSQPESVEDYLQEFGRAGRDGEQALAVIFDGDPNDEGIRTYLAEQTVKQLDIAPAAKKDILAGKTRNIEALHNLLIARSMCLRSGVIRHLEVERPRQFKDKILEFLEWFFSYPTFTRNSRFCCDFCHPEVAQEVLEYGYVHDATATSNSKQRDAADFRPSSVSATSGSSFPAKLNSASLRNRYVAGAIGGIGAIAILCVACICLALLLG